MKFLVWLFSVNKRHYREALRYESGGVASRIVYIIMMLLLCVLSVGMELLCFKLFESSFLYGFICLLFTLSIAAVTVETCGVHSYYGFKFFFLGTLCGVINKVADSKGLEGVSTSTDGSNQKSKKYLDLFIGIFGAILSVGVVAAMLAILLSGYWAQ